MSAHPIFVGTASWNISKENKTAFPSADSQLKSYAHVLNGVEINSSFYRNHQAKTYERWAEEVPDKFRFSVKLLRLFTHEQRLRTERRELAAVLCDIIHLGPRLGALLVQLPPSLVYERNVAHAFFAALRELFTLPVAFEPRHSSWVSDEALQTLSNFRISKVIADPDPCYRADIENSALSDDLAYVRLHGSPVIYESAYDPAFIGTLGKRVEQLSKNTPTWCIFDNTTFGHATRNALDLTTSLVRNEPLATTRSDSSLSF